MSAQAEPGPVNVERPGEVLRRAREQHRYTIEQVAQKLMLANHIIEAMEAEDYELLPSAIYTRGYLRHYGHLLGLDPEPLVRDFNKHLPPLQLRPIWNCNRQIGSDDRRVRIISTLVVAVMLILLVLYWQQEWVSRSTPAVQEQIGEQSVEVALPALSRPSVEPPEELPTLGEQQVPAPEEVPQDSTPATTEPDPTAPEAAAAELEAGAETDRLTLALSDQCWIEIQDAKGNLLLAQMGQADERFSINGSAPFSILIGNAAAITSFQFNDEPVDISDYARANVARLQLGE